MSGPAQRFRLDTGGLIDRSRPLSFTFGGRSYIGFEGDTLASALLANGVRVLGRSFKYHRPRGILGAGVEEPNALMQLGSGNRSTPNIRATEVELFDGLTAVAVNCWPNVNFDIGGANNLFSCFLSAGFYYKTFMWPDWHLYETIIRKAAGLGRVPKLPDPDRYETRYAHCDVLVIGSGAAGLAASRAAARSGARVILVEQDGILGGSLNWDAEPIDGKSAAQWIAESAAMFEAEPEMTVLTRTAAVGYFDHNALTLIERLAWDPNSLTRDGATACRLWQVRAKQVILATGALERPIAFGGNDRPGVMLASAVREYLMRYAVAPGRRAVLFTNNDHGYRTAFQLLDAGVQVAAVVDPRQAPADFVRALGARNVAVHPGAVICDTKGYKGLSSVQLRDSSGKTRWIDCDLLAMSGGYNPTVHLYCQAGGKLAYDENKAFFAPAWVGQAVTPVGGAAGAMDLPACLAEGHQAGLECVTGLGFDAEASPPRAAAGRVAQAMEPLWSVRGGRNKAFVDFQNDVSVSDIALAKQESFVSVEHLKRYTTLGMAADQGKTSNVNALAIMASLTGRSIGETGTTRYRFPFTPVPLGSFRGAATGKLFRPFRTMPGHRRHAAHDAAFEDYGGWLRPAYYPLPGETPHAAEQREALLVRNGVGLFEGSPLGKIEVKGPDAGKFLDLIYANTMSTLKAGRCRYGLMLNELGVIIDDGVTAKLADDHYLVGTTGAGADRIAAWLEEWLQCEWLDFDVIVAPISTSWGVLTISGPAARDLLQALGTDFAVDASAFPHMSFVEGHVAGIQARVFRVSYTGEISYEINVPSSQVETLWDAVMNAGKPHGIAPVGVDAWMVLRTEKGFLHIGADTDGTTSPLDVGWGHVLKKKCDFVGKRSLLRPNDQSHHRLQLVGLRAQDGTQALPVGAHIAAPAGSAGSAGFVTSSSFSPILGRGVAMGMLAGGMRRRGETVMVMTDQGHRPAEVVALAAYDPSGERLNG
ncbi:sarcosine oxidase subunit alpha [Sphingobium sp. AP50]|uniref:sarcosine oxidase subunit alpha family protein n=1 Tax=Sphingobium sp. AP50 TaxID=1884369 RepID=UPI0008AFA5F0|nr:sarcosine oxidase subunit alpha family protein [Sphingobium sp. AP50]SEJ98697.1 sarcosine oxidase subunit alpha [Sphingobium sp. AP50]